MKYLKGYKLYESKNSIESICKEYGIKNYIINDDGTIDVDGDVLFYKRLTNIPLKFGRVSGTFYCNNNKLTSLEGSPKSVGGHFHCDHNQLTSLKGSPRSIGGDFECELNNLTSLQGCPDIIGGHFNCCINNNITDFKGVSEYFEGRFYCDNNPISEIYSLFFNVKCIKWINEFDVIQGNRVIMDRLEEVYHQLGLDIPENIYLPSYEII